LNPSQYITFFRTSPFNKRPTNASTCVRPLSFFLLFLIGQVRHALWALVLSIIAVNVYLVVASVLSPERRAEAFWLYPLALTGGGLYFAFLWQLLRRPTSHHTCSRQGSLSGFGPGDAPGDPPGFGTRPLYAARAVVAAALGSPLGLAGSGAGPTPRGRLLGGWERRSEAVLRTANSRALSEGLASSGAEPIIE